MLISRTIQTAMLALASLALAGCAGSGMTGLAPECGQNTGVPMLVAMSGRGLVIPARINGVTLSFLVDTGAAASVIERRTALAMGLMRDVTQKSIRDVAGERVVDVVRVQQIAISSFVYANHAMFVSDGLPLDGVIGLDILSHYDLDIDEPRGRLTLHPIGLCKSDRPVADGPILEMEAIRAISSGSGAEKHTEPFLMVAIKLDGQASLAMLDTGALGGTVVSQRFADKIGVSAEQLAEDRSVGTRGLGPHTQLMLHQFNELNIGGEVFKHPRLLVSSDTGSRFPLVLGADYFSKHRVWMNFAADRVFSMPVVPQSIPGS